MCIEINNEISRGSELERSLRATMCWDFGPMFGEYLYYRVSILLFLNFNIVEIVLLLQICKKKKVFYM